MGIDASIPLGIRPVQIENPVNAMVRVLQAQGLQRENEMGGLKMDEYRRGVTRTNKLHELLQSGADPKRLRQEGFLKESLEWEEKNAKTERERIAGQKDTADIENKTIALYRDASQAIADPQSAMDFVRTIHSDPRLKDSAIARVPLDKLLAQIPQDPAQLDAWKQQFALGATKFMELNKPQYVTSNTGQKTVTTAIEGLTGSARPVNELQNTASPGDVLSSNDRRAALAETARHHRVTEGHAAVTANAAKLSQPFTVAGPDGKDVLVQQDKTTGQLIPVRGGYGPKGAEKEPTEGERKAGTLLHRLEGSQRQLEAALKEDPTAAKPQLISSGLRSLGMEAAANTNDNPARRRVEAAQLDLLDAALTLGTGAAYTKEQLEGYRKSYFPQIGDDAQAIKDKQDRLNNVIQAAKIAAGRAAKTSPTAPPPPQNQGGASGDWGTSVLDQADAILRGGGNGKR